MRIGFEFVEFEKQNLSGYTLVEGFPGMGLVGTIAAKYLVEKLGFEQIGYVDSEIFAPIIRIHNGVPIRPARIYANKSKKIVVLISEQVIGKQFTYFVAKKTVEWVKKKGISKIISLSGVQTSVPSKREVIYGIAANEKSRELLKKFGLSEIEDGITTGVTALILLELRRTNLKAISILGNVELSADYKASAEVLKKLDQALNLNLDVEPLLKEARETEKQLIDHLKKLRSAKDNSTKFEARETPLVT